MQSTLRMQRDASHGLIKNWPNWAFYIARYMGNLYPVSSRNAAGARGLDYKQRGGVIGP